MFYTAIKPFAKNRKMNLSIERRQESGMKKKQDYELTYFVPLFCPRWTDICS